MYSPGRNSFNLKGPVPTHFVRSSAVGTWAGYTGEYPAASIRRRDGWGRLRRKITVSGFGVWMSAMFSYQSFRGLTRSLAGAPGASRRTSKVYFTSFDVNGCPSCHLTPLRRWKTRAFPPSRQAHFSANSPTMVLSFSSFFSGSKRTRLL